VAPHVVFKGGTSLSRAYRLIQRFSEDIDILVEPGSLVVGSNQLDRLLERIDKRARPYILEKGGRARVSSGKKGLYTTFTPCSSQTRFARAFKRWREERQCWQPIVMGSASSTIGARRHAPRQALRAVTFS
jgi:Nucleotidyl transferase AbiEii toxin, Type IV TA system